ncbi:hypothetical protein TNCV_1942291 [Trichonephila clavipes]|uniref:Uncharacterized protein n=1 Tax=Trichonephila clavipes TaxID=2585209 RepID=A0A8X6S9M0_TRICX|nr:hypothetical protein TNCV_701751 [Trichonephila clavipes]GFX24531.1 hypothetical protein TNCV_1584871 [Trichonephila clavipes]GFY09419.1 hypothetical protein TNCV_1942291 [Trichonephila clavipes]
MVLFGSEIIKNRVCVERVSMLRVSNTCASERRRRIPFDYQKTSLAGLALDSATSSGLGRAPRSAMQDPIQAPPGATRQAGLYTS